MFIGVCLFRGGSLVTSLMSFPKEGVGYPWYQIPSSRYGFQWGRVYPRGIGYLGGVGYTRGVVHSTPYPPLSLHGVEGTAVVGTHPTGMFSSFIVSTLCRTVEMLPYCLGGSSSLGSLND